VRTVLDRKEDPYTAASRLFSRMVAASSPETTGRPA